MEIKHAVLHEPLFYPGIGTIPSAGNSLTKENTNMSNGYKMILKQVEGASLLEVSIKDKVGKTVVILVPVTSFKILVPA